MGLDMNVIVRTPPSIFGLYSVADDSDESADSELFCGDCWFGP